MSIDPVLIRHVFDQSFAIFLSKETAALLGNVNERNSCGRLALYMEGVAKENGLSAYFADTEYNRKQDGRVKTILDDDCKIVTINCDLILHSRGTVAAADNLIAVEMKKSVRPANEKQKDRDRLRALTKASYDDIWSADGVARPEHVCGYVLGAYIEINRIKRSCLVEYYSSGAKIGQRRVSFFSRTTILPDMR